MAADNLELAEELTDWWLSAANDEAKRVVPKACEYGPNSLIFVGRELAQIAGRVLDSDEQAIELGIFWYLSSKVARWRDAVMRGDRPSDDTIADISTYAKMAMRNRQVGSWPGV